MSTKDLTPATSSIHGELLEQLTPGWLIDATPARRAALKAGGTRLPQWYSSATTERQRALRETSHASFTAQTLLDKTMSALKDIDAFAEPLLSKALKDRFGVEVDVSKTLVCLRRPLEVGVLEIEVSTFEVMKLSLLQATLHNFEESECKTGAFHSQSGFIQETSTPGVFQAVSVNMTVTQFLSLCRSLDIGAQYQTYVKAFFQPADAGAGTTLRQQYMTSQKATLRAAAEVALLKKDIEPADYAMILSIIKGELHPRLGSKPVWFRDLSLMNRRMTGCVVFSISEKFRYSSEFILYIPHDPEHPLKRYTSDQLREEFKRQFTVRGGSHQSSDGPTAHQRFFSQFVAYADHPYYFSQFTRKAADAPGDPLDSIWVKVAQLIPPFSTFARIKQLPPERSSRQEPVDDPYLNPSVINQAGGANIWAANTDLFTYLYEQSCAKVIADARSHAVPTAAVDAKVRTEKLNHLLEIGMLGFNIVSMFVPVLGEIMMVVMASQLLYETFEGAIEWSEGDHQAAKAHLIDVAENLAFIAVLGGVAKAAGKLAVVKPAPVVERLEPVTRSNGDSRLWKPDLGAYESDIVPGTDSSPDALGLHRVGDKTCIRQAGKVYETTFDKSLKKWRIKHPTDAQAWQPILKHNGHGAWRHSLERPLTWDRLALLRRMGHITEAFTDEQLLKIADISGVGDNALRKMHMDHLPPPPELIDVMRLFEADLTGTAVIESVEPGSPVDRLQRACPGLGEAAAQRVLLDANAEELTRLKTTRHIPLRMLEEARWYAQQGRLSRAFVGLHGERMMSADSRWLALHALEQLPGWSDAVRLEVRDGHINGPLLEGVGSETAVSRKYLVKNGPSYQAFDERGEMLNSVPRDGHNFYTSIMHALPDESRTALGIPHVAQSGELRRAVIDSAIEHRAKWTQQLQAPSGSRGRFKPPVRVAEHSVGYYASGRGQGINPSLTTRVQDVYPGLSDRQANGFILEQLRNGKTDAQVYSLLQERSREWDTLESALDQWVSESVSGTVWDSMLDGRAAVARNIKECWRNSPLAEQYPQLQRLELTSDDPLPSLSADFSHVRELNVRGQFVTDTNVETLVAHFPNLKTLRINGSQFTNVPEALSSMQHLVHLSLYSAVPFAVDMPSRLSSLTRLEALHVYSSGFAPMELDVIRMRNLRSLEVLAPSMFEWPAGALDLPFLERLNLKHTSIRTLPEGLFQGHEKLWSGLSLDWSLFLRENFKPAYEYVKNYPEHLVDQEEMVRDYCRGELQRLGEGLNQSSATVFIRFTEQWQDAEARFKAIEEMSEQRHQLDQQLNEWSEHALLPGTSVQQILGRTRAATLIRACWRNGAFKRYGGTLDASVLELPDLQFNELPQLPVGAFDHVRTLYLPGLRAPVEQISRFVGGFTELKTLDLSGNDLTQVPIASGDLAKLTHLDLSANQIIVDPAVQQVFDGLGALESLDLSINPLNSLDVSGMPHLISLNLQATALHEWPKGAEHLPDLNWLDLRNTRISSLPQAVLEGDMPLKTNLTGAPLTQPARTVLNAARQRIELTRNLPVGTLERFDAQAVPSVFPPSESGYSLAGHLLPLPDVPAAEGAAHFVKRLQRLKPALADGDALQVIEQWRESGTTDVEIGERLAGWDQTFDTLTRELNGWLYTRESHGAGWAVTSAKRRQGALRILECWREGLTVAEGAADVELTLNGLQLGDLPELPAAFSHVGSLNLSGIRHSAQGSNGFLKAFTRLKRLALNGNDLQTLPEPVQYMANLERLELSTNRLGDTGQLYAALNPLERLTWLDLSYNALDSFDVGGFERLETLDLSNNNLTDWPQGVLDAQRLRTLILSRNDITSIPALAFDSSHDVLLAGTDLSDNYNLSRESLERIRDYRQRTALDSVLGLSHSDLDEMIDENGGDGDSDDSSVESDEVLPDVEPDSEQQAPWLANALPEELASKTQIWSQLAAEPDHAAFFHLLARLQDTQEFRVANADLTRRVWTVMEAAASNSELREILFASSNTHGTCVDGRILTFSGLESKVFTHNALLDMPVGRLALKGRALLKLSRQLFRLDKVDDWATNAAMESGEDEAEVRLGYRIGLTSGWSDGLELPGQPKHMTFSSGVTSAQMAEARTAVINAEQGDAFFEDLIQRDYWVDYLKEKYPEVFNALDEVDVGADDQTISADDPAFLSQLFDQAAARNAKLIELSRKVVEAIESTGGGAGSSTAGANL
ncbi:MAG: NEL-type E3 ubiquitin ligase domain-containing protein [Pseudomonas sp.]|uniref:NEL-type E3 ubiquitin ligase domain-containing protein n=1 Tax=Pseudomonas sp. TaxID=306 RepID=UPI003D6E8236